MSRSNILRFALSFFLLFHVFFRASIGAPVLTRSAHFSEDATEHRLLYQLAATARVRASDDPRQRSDTRLAKWHFGKSVQLQKFVPMRVPTHWESDCGQYVIANIFSALGCTISARAYDKLGEVINPSETGVKIPDLLLFLSHAFDCDVPSSATEADIVRHLDRGLPVVAVVETHDGNLHGIIVSGYTANAYGKIQSWTIADNGVLRGVHSPDAFAKLWRCPSHSTLENICILIQPNDGSPKPRQRQGDAKVVEDQTEHCTNRQLMIGALSAKTSAASDSQLIEQIEDRLRDSPFIPQSPAEAFLLEQFESFAANTTPQETTISEHIAAFIGALDGYIYLLVTPIAMVVLFAVAGALFGTGD